MRSGIKKSKSKNWKGKPPYRCEAEYSDFDFDDACQTNLLMAKFCPDEARNDFLCDVPFRIALHSVCSNACAEA
jgi:hypothetical protein